MPNFSPLGRLIVAIIALVLLVQLLITVATIIRNIIHLQIIILRIFIIWPAWILIRILLATLKLLRLIIVVLVWAVCSVVRGVTATFTLFGLFCRRHESGESSSNDNEGESLMRTNRQQANVMSVQDMGMAERGGYGWQVHVLLPDGSVRSGHNIGILVGGMDGNARAWQANTPRRYG